MIAGDSAGRSTFYTYIHTRADDGKVFYVGKGMGARSTSERNRNPHWHRTVKKHGLHVDIVARWSDEGDAFDHEKILIACFRGMGHPLCNQTDGGDGISGYRHTAETRAKLSSMQIGKEISVEHRLKISVAGKGRLHTAEAKAKISAKNKGIKRTEEQRLANSLARIGSQMTDKCRAALLAANTGRVVSAETRAKMSARRIGKPVSEEARGKISAANKGRKRTPQEHANVIAAQTGMKRSDESKARMSAANMGRKVSAETRAKISLTLLGRRPSDSALRNLREANGSPERRAKQSAALKGKPWSPARRAAQMLKE